ncbi:lipid A biosynthesis acyltransferase [Parasulfuritortus cantonensis]|uniref:Lipid A biosynthesis acyltransferase n=1 Tax=Parasulfuritortus cantonensis TaxID=2528202 RepID=A0A4R1B8Z3_9PROT|nr:lipid A biosynthesis acyltransferase [Parasulfuritortus cantonensis]TCJ12809.1 lipid A biosynthesis acyltransferase [Parasulfuritortus cantonensis]
MIHPGIALLRLLHAAVPVTTLARLGEWLGSALYPVSPTRRHIGLTNLRLCFPELTEAERRRLLKAHFRALGRATLLETVSWWGERAEVEGLTRLEGLDNLLPYLGKPLIWLAPHFVGLNIGGVRVSTEYAPVVSLYAHIKNPEVDRLMLHARTRFGGSELYSRQDGIKPVIRAIRKGLPFYYLPDMDFGRKDAVFVPFFGVPAATITGLSRLAKATGAVVVPCITRWQDGGYVARFYPPWQDFPSADVVADTRRMNAFIEDRIREMPEQYFWLHKRFKTRPDEKRKGGLYED